MASITPVQLHGPEAYGDLYEHLKGGGEALGYVDCKFRGGGVWRDPIEIRIMGDGRAYFGVRGTSYGNEARNLAEFIPACIALNLRFVLIQKDPH